MIKYLVASSEAGGRAEAMCRGWTAIGRIRFVTAEKDDVRLVWRFGQMVPDRGGVTVFVRSGDFPEEPRARGEDGDLATPDAADFDEFVRIGAARWE